jgi:predicted Zn-dependent protease with MMP-like domain
MHLTRKAFDRLVEDAIAGLPDEFAQWLDEVPVIVEDRPGKGDPLPGGADEDAPVGLYVGRGRDELPASGDLPPRIMIYREPLMAACGTREQLAEEIRKTLVHELGHYAGMDEDELDARGYGPVEGDDEIEWDVEEDGE